MYVSIYIYLERERAIYMYMYISCAARQKFLHSRKKYISTLSFGGVWAIWAIRSAKAAV